MRPVFITGIGTDVGKTLVSAVVVKALNASYWKPIQAGGLDNTDSNFVNNLTGRVHTIHPEAYRLQMAASPHTAARAENIRIETAFLEERFKSLPETDALVIEGAGGLMVPLNDKGLLTSIC